MVPGVVRIGNEAKPFGEAEAWSKFTVYDEPDGAQDGMVTDKVPMVTVPVTPSPVAPLMELFSQTAAKLSLPLDLVSYGVPSAVAS